ncbi:MAG: hypothetical protein ACYC64_03160 [Armatimonadota bacterium]
MGNQICESSEAVCKLVHEQIEGAELSRSHLLAAEPFPLSAGQVALLEQLGDTLLKFYQAANDLYLRSDHGWVREYLDIGKGDDLVRHARMKYQKQALPRIIRPDILITDDGFVITELDSVPGGFGQLDCLSAAYENAGYNLVGSPGGVRDGFASMLREDSGTNAPVCAIVVSDESIDYLPEMTYLARKLRGIGLRAYAVHPREVNFTEDGLFIDADGERLRVDTVYRFFELFDLLNIPKSELLSYAARKKLAAVTPPYKHFLEEKMLLALIHSEMLHDYWTKSLGEECFEVLKRTVAPTWIMDNRPVPPHAEVSGFRWKGKPIRDWREIIEGTQKDRRLVLKPSGFSPLAWGARGVKIGHDMPQQEWAESVENALSSFETSPYVLQQFHDTALFGVKYGDDGSEMKARVRLCPYYFVYGDRANLGGVLATACPKDKKLIHGMVDAVMMPCRLQS